MPLGIVSDEDFDSEIADSCQKKPAEIIQIPRGRGEGNTEVPESVRKIISESALDGVPAKNISSAFGISPSSISAYKNSATSTRSYHEKNKELESHNSSVRSRISDRATRKIMLALRQITPDKVQEAKLRDIASLAKDMSAVVKNLEGNQRGGVVNNGPTYVFYTPRIRKEQEYEVIEMNEE